MDAKLNRFVKLLLKKKIKLAFAESVTCGMIAHQLCTIKGTSDVFMGSIVCYLLKVKTGLLSARHPTSTIFFPFIMVKNSSTKRNYLGAHL